jgi:hypothetical protein
MNRLPLWEGLYPTRERKWVIFFFIKCEQFVLVVVVFSVIVLLKLFFLHLNERNNLRENKFKGIESFTM